MVVFFAPRELCEGRMTDGDTHFFFFSEVGETGEVDRAGWVSVFAAEGLALTPLCAIARPKLAHKKPRMYRTNCAPILEILLRRAMTLTFFVSESARAVAARDWQSAGAAASAIRNNINIRVRKRKR